MKRERSGKLKGFFVVIPSPPQAGEGSAYRQMTGEKADSSSPRWNRGSSE
jgi:hypothetical protein